MINPCWNISAFQLHSPNRPGLNATRITGLEGESIRGILWFKSVFLDWCIPVDYPNRNSESNTAFSLRTTKTLCKVFHDVIRGAGVKVIEEADEHKLESPQIQPFIYSSPKKKKKRPPDGERERCKTIERERGREAAVPHVPARDLTTDSTLKWKIRL